MARHNTFPGIRTTALAVLLVLVAVCNAAAQDDFPLRPFFPHVPVISTKELGETYREAIIVDVRTRFEHEVASINKAVLLPWGTGFLEQLGRLRTPGGSSLLVFYCNDPTCIRAYKAAQEAINAGFENVRVYDAGVFAWMNAHADQATLLGTSPAYPEAALGAEIYAEHRLQYSQFSSLAYERTTKVIDIRDIYHRELVPVIHGLRNIPLEAFIQAITNRVWTEHTLLILDNNESQTRWLQYFLEANGYLDYYFLADGVDGLPRLQGVLRPPREKLAEVTIRQEQLAGLTTDPTLGEGHKELFLYLVSRLRFENISLVSMEFTAEEMHTSTETVHSAAEKLQKAGYLLYSTVGDTLIAQIAPDLAWKGEMEGAIWEKRRREFAEARKTEADGGVR